MPHTINGIGTHYYGAKNRSARVGICQACGRSATLSSYDTREFFCFVFIPLIPLGKYRVLNDCSACRRHHRIKADEFARQLDEATAPLREAIRRSPRDPQPYVDLVQTLVAWEMRTDAERELEAAVQLFPQNVEMILQTAQMAVDRGDWNRALPHFERAYGIDSQNPAATYGYGWILHRLERHEQAIPILQRAVSQDANKVGATYLLAESHMKLSHWNDALSSYQHLLSLEPGYAQDKKLLRTIRECKKHLGYELSDAERRAGRSWWPFGRKNKPATLQPQPALVRPSLRIAGIVLLVVMVFSLGAVAWDEKTNIKVYFDNGLDRIVQIDIDGNQFDLAPQGRKSETLKEGEHTVVVRDQAGKEIERQAFRLDEQSFFDAMAHDRFFVYNVGAQHVYRRAHHGYAKRAEDSTYTDELIGMQRFLEQRDVDFEFERAPEQIKTDSSSSVVKKVSFTVAEDVDLATYAVIRLGEGKKDDAKAAIDRAAANAPCHTPTRRTQVYLTSMIATHDAAATTARQWIADCAENDLEAHRTYQDIHTERGLEGALRDEYARLVSSTPQSAKAHYLHGRVTSDLDLAVREYQEAIRLDPKLPWPRVALGHAYGEMERYDDALRELGAALDTEGCDPVVAGFYAGVAIAKGSPENAVAKVEEIRKARTDDMVAVDARWRLALAAADWDTAAGLQQILKAHETPDTTWWRETKVLRMKGDAAVEQRIEEALASEESRGVATQVKAMVLIEKGEYAQAAEMVAKNADALGVSTAALLQAYAAGGLLIQGDRAAGTKLLADVDAMLANAPAGRESRMAALIVKACRGQIAAEAAIREARDSNLTEHGAFAAAVQAALANDRSRAAAHLARAARAASDLEFPYLEVKAMAGRMK